MRPLYKSDILRLAKPIEDLLTYSVYFLICEQTIIYVGYSEQPYKRVSHHLKIFTADSYHILNFDTKDEALAAEVYYIKTFNPYRNLVHTDEGKNIIAERKKEREAYAATFDTSGPQILKLMDDPTSPNVEIEVQPITKVPPPKEKNLILCTDKINLLNNNYIKKDGNIYLKIDNALFRMPEGAMFGRYKNVLYRKPTKLFGNIIDIKILDIPY